MKKFILFIAFLLAGFMQTGFAQLITLAQSVFDCSNAPGTEQFFNAPVSNGAATPRNIYTIPTAAPGFSNGGGQVVIQWNAGLSRWEILVNTMPADLLMYSTFASAPNPPNSTVGNWIDGGFGCSPYSVTGPGTQNVVVLPVELLNFNVTTERSKNLLTWATASEINNKTFDVERSVDGRTFTSLCQIEAANQPSNYQFIDNQPFITSYYRLRQIDFDGTATYSKVVSVLLPGTNRNLKVYPTLVADGFLTVDTENLETLDFSIYNLLGQSVQHGQITSQLDVLALAKGTYILQVGAEQVKFVKQ